MEPSVRDAPHAARIHFLLSSLLVYQALYGRHRVRKEWAPNSVRGPRTSRRQGHLRHRRCTTSQRPSPFTTRQDLEILV